MSLKGELVQAFQRHVRAVSSKTRDCNFNDLSPFRMRDKLHGKPSGPSGLIFVQFS